MEYWFRRFKSGDFDTSDKEREGRSVKFEDAELKALLAEDSGSDLTSDFKPSQDHGHGAKTRKLGFV